MLEIHEEAPRPLQDWVKDEGAMRLRSRALSIPNDDVKLKKRRYADSVSEEDTNSKPLAAELGKDPDLWFPDGNLVLEAGGVTFKVYGGLLAAQSEVFRRLLGEAHAKRMELDLSSFADDCPTIRLTDRPDDLRHLLRGIFFSSSLYVLRR